MISPKVTSHYSKALFELGSSHEELKKHLSELKKIVQLSDEETDLGQLFLLPIIDKEEKNKTLRSILKGKIDEKIIEFLCLLIEKDRIQYLKEIVLSYEKLVKKELGIVTVGMSTAVPADPKLKEKIYKKLKDAYPQNEIEIEEQVNPDIIGGMIITIENQMFDNSIRNRLDKLKKDLYQMKV